MPDYGHELAFGTFLTPQYQWPAEVPPKRGSTTMNKECLSTTRQLVTS
jgi:hypothetical protein